MSKQRDHLIAVWETNKAEVMAGILGQADDWLTHNDQRNSPHGMWDYYFGDGLWDPLTALSDDYDRCIRDNGNADDECQLIEAMWIYTMAQNNTGKYNTLIQALAESMVEGY
jgi:hypothetical protein